jgi:ubiquinone/menaquinone biosynthesis C-methylase UbiE
MIEPQERRYLKNVRREVAGGAAGKVLEIGAGTGLNFTHYRDDAQVTATEPDPYMLEKARQRLSEVGKPIELRQASAEELPFEDDTFDTVLGTLVMCSVLRPRQALAEIRRVLKPGGEYRFYEHVRYRHPFGALWQDLILPVWRWFAAGCHPNRDTGRLIREAGFEILDSEYSKPFPPIPPMIFSRPHLKGLARNPD